MSIIKKQGISSAIFLGIGILLGFLTNILLFPKIMGLEIYGFTQWLMSLLAFTGFLGGFGITNIITKYFPYYQEPPQKKHFFSFSVIYGSVGILITVFVLFLLKDFIIGTIDNEADALLAQKHYYLLFIGAVCILYNDLFIAYLKSLLKVRVPIFLQEVLVRLLTLLLIVFYFFEWISLPTFLTLFIVKFVFILGTLLVYLWSIQELKLNLKGHLILKTKQVKGMLNFAAFAFLSKVSNIIIARIDILMITAFLDFKNVGIYSVFALIASLIKLPHNAFSPIVTPIIANAWKENDVARIQQLYQQTSLNNLVGGMLIFLLIESNLHNLINFLGVETYSGGYAISLWLGIGYLVLVSLGINSIIMINSTHYQFDLLTKLIMVVLTVGLNYLLIPQLGLMGAALATSITLISVNIIISLIIFIKFKLQPYTLQTFKLILIALFVWSINQYLPTLSYWIFDLVYRSILIAFLFIGLVLHFRISPEINNFVGNLKKS